MSRRQSGCVSIFPRRNHAGRRRRNLPSVLAAICADSTRGRNLMSWLQELTPMDVKDFDFPRDPSGRVHLQIVERNGRKVSAYSASDGTLRFLGILAALLGPNEGGLYFFEGDRQRHPPQPPVAATRPNRAANQRRQCPGDYYHSLAGPAGMAERHGL